MESDAKFAMARTSIKDDDLAKSQKSRHSGESGSPELFELTGFLLSQE